MSTLPIKHHLVRDLILFSVIISLLIVALLSIYFYDLRQPYFSNWAAQFYHWLIN